MTGIFQHGVASGDPLQDRVILWTRLTVPTAADVQLSWTIANDSSFENVVNSGTGLACATDDHTVRIDATGLRPGRYYFYRFHALGDTSPIGRTRTLPASDARRVRFAQVSSARFNAGFFNAYARIAARAERGELDFLLHLGNYIYESADIPPSGQAASADVGRPFEPLHECTALADYRARYNQYHRDPDLQRLHASLPLFSTVAEHELAARAWHGGAASHDAHRAGRWADRVTAALRARHEWLPIRLPDPVDPQRIHRVVHLGRLADLFLLDTCSQRDEPAPSPRLHDPDRSMLGIPQRKWLFSEFEQSASAWRILASPSLLGTTWQADLPELARQPLLQAGLLAPNGPGHDHWDGYPAERYLLLRRMRDHKLRNFLVLSGTVGISLAQELKLDPLNPASPPIAAECAGAGLTAPTFDDQMKWPPRAQSVPYEQELLRCFPEMKYIDLDSHGYNLVDVTRERVLVEWWNAATVLHRTDKEWRGAAFQISSGSPTLVSVQ